MYILLSGKPPFNGKTDKEIQKRIISGNPVEFPSPHFDKISEKATALIGQMLVFGVKERIAAK